jgi:hypothetical protein
MDGLRLVFLLPALLSAKLLELGLFPVLPPLTFRPVDLPDLGDTTLVALLRPVDTTLAVGLLLR